MRIYPGQVVKRAVFIEKVILMRKVYDTVIVGAGPAGMTAAIYAVSNGIRVLLLDRQDKVGKKLLVTGNGRCNITNLDQKPEYYRSDAPGEAWSIFSEYNEKEIIKLMDNLGILTKDRAGYVYPYNDQASSVREAFEDYLYSLPGLEIMTESAVTQISQEQINASKKNASFSIIVDTGKGHCRFLTDKLIIATGGYAGTKAGWGGDGYRFAKEFGHHIIRPAPALTALCSGAPFLKKLAGVRSRASITLLVNNQPLCRETGELQWTDYGISGVAVFSLSRFAIRAINEGQKVSVSIDLLPDLEPDELVTLMKKLRGKCGFKNCISFLNGMIAQRLSPVIYREAGLDRRDKGSREYSRNNSNNYKQLKELTDQELITLAMSMKEFMLRINGYKSYEKAQVTMGGIPLSELTHQLESKLCPGLFFAGEVVDVDGTCGGYNLSWAFASGRIAGKTCRISI